IDGGPAAAAGLHVGDVIVRFDDKTPTDDRDLLRLIASSDPGRTVSIGVLRNGKDVNLSAKLAEWPKMQWEERDGPTKVMRPHWLVPPDLGLTVETLTHELMVKNHVMAPPSMMGAAADRVGVLVTGVE